jgi:hypothetical protein
MDTERKPPPLQRRSSNSPTFISHHKLCIQSKNFPLFNLQSDICPHLLASVSSGRIQKAPVFQCASSVLPTLISFQRRWERPKRFSQFTVQDDYCPLISADQTSRHQPEFSGSHQSNVPPAAYRQSLRKPSGLSRPRRNSRSTATSKLT